MRKLNMGLVPFAVLLGLGASPIALAQEAPPEGESGGDIVVTALKRSERLQDVPVSIAAIGGDAVKDQRITRADDLVMKMPNLQVTSTVGEGTPIFSLRGVSMSDFSLNQSGPVATYYDEVYKGNYAFLGVAMYDLERIEVLRGPQGTLYGKNTTGGAVNLISARPEYEFSGSLSAGYGNYNRIESSGYVNVPLGDAAAFRVAGTFARADGWFKNTLAGQPDLDGVREYGLRASLLVEPSPDLTFLLRASTSYQNPYNYGIYGESGPLGTGAGVYEAFGQGTSYFRPAATNGRREGELNYVGRRDARTYSVALNSKWEMGEGLSLISVTSWDKGRLSFIEDTDGSPRSVIEIDYGDRAEQVAEDLRLASDWSSPFNFILGFYFNREKVFNTSTQGLFRDLDYNGDGAVNDQDCRDSAPAGDFLACSITNSFDQLKKSYAVYSDMSYKITDMITLRGGLRYSHDKGDQTDVRSDAFGVDGGFAATLIAPLSRNYSAGNLSGKIGVDVKPSRDVLLYANYSRGYRAPSFNAQAFFDPSEATVAKAETVDAFELGWKTQLADRRVTFNGAMFYYNYSNQQFINVDANTAVQRLVNVDKSRIYGAEAELSVRAADMLSFRAGLGLLNAKIKRGTLGGVDLAGNRLTNAPSVSASGGIDLTLIDDGVNKFSVHPEVSYVSSQFFEVLNVPRLRQDSYALLAGHIKYQRGPFSATIWGKNLTNKFYYTARIDTLGVFGFDYNHLGGPRTFGATVSYDF
ncbi:MAG TPA: TonB-dependent receptor [Sphingobium sp.]|uniref:TonB-dependent receptor n=1 Tax=Sphingobium sp. TaxID=1912891 RepID=UPI002ED43C3C